jgi:hypothetical protein
MLHYVHSSLIYNSQKLERSQMSINRGMDTENVLHLHKVWTLRPFLELGTKHQWKELQRQILELRQKDGPSRDFPPPLPRIHSIISHRFRHYCTYQHDFVEWTLI